jgi:hypothetical protein
VQKEGYYGPPLRRVNTMCRWNIENVVKFKPFLPRTSHGTFTVPTPEGVVNLISVLQLLQRGAKVEFSSQGARIRNNSNGKNLYTASQYHGEAATSFLPDFYNAIQDPSCYKYRMGGLGMGPIFFPSPVNPA